MTAATVEPDFTGYATRNDLECADGRTILRDAFKDNHGTTVPLFWQHGHNDIDNVLGRVELENVEDGVRAKAFFNKTPRGQNAKEMVRHGDVKWLSIFANHLVEQGKKVLKGNIREVSLVLAGANPGALIDHISLAHYDDPDNITDGDAEITTGLEIEVPDDEEQEQEMAHDDAAGDEGNDLQKILSTLNPEQETAVNFLLTQALTVGSTEVQHSDTEVVTDEEGSEETESDAEEDKGEGSEETGSDAEEANADDEGSEETGSEDNETDAEGEGSEEAGSDAEEGEGSEETAATAESGTTEDGTAVQHDTTTQEDTSMEHNLFETAGAETTGGELKHAFYTETKEPVTLSHDDVKQIMATVVNRNSTLSATINDYAMQHGIENIDYLFPDFKTLTTSPTWIARRTEWVDKVLNAVRKVPWARIKSVTADITPDEARARGYITGNLKNEEFFELSKRETTPQTVYKKQKLDRDDVIDVADFDVITWMKAEMKMMLDEEIASAILFGDGRSSGDEDKIKEANIRPIASDAELYITTVNVNLGDANSSAEEIVDAAIINRTFFKGSGQPTFYTTPGIIAKFKLAKDGNGQRYYKTNVDIANALDVAEVVPVETMVRVPDLVGIMVNLADYSIGTDRLGVATMFDDFDLDYNKLRYLLETRLSGALTTPKAAVVFRSTASANVLVEPDPVTFNRTTGVATVPTKTGVVYKSVDPATGVVGSTLTAGAQTAVAPGAKFAAKAVPASGYYFANDQTDDYSFTRDA